MSKNVFTYEGICKICSPEKMSIDIATLKKNNVKIKKGGPYGPPLFTYYKLINTTDVVDPLNLHWHQ